MSDFLIFVISLLTILVSILSIMISRIALRSARTVRHARLGVAPVNRTERLVLKRAGYRVYYDFWQNIWCGTGDFYMVIGCADDNEAWYYCQQHYERSHESPLRIPWFEGESHG